MLWYIKYAEFSHRLNKLFYSKVHIFCAMMHVYLVAVMYDQIDACIAICVGITISVAYKYVYLYESERIDIHIYPTPPLGQDMTQGQF